MKREIYCMHCKERVMAVIDEGSLPPGEHVKYVDGKALAQMMCDFCGKDIKQGWYCCCFSNYMDKARPYAPWEDEFVEILPEVGADPRVPIPAQGVYVLLISGVEEQLLRYHLSLCTVLNFLERRQSTVKATCMSESLELAIAMAKRLDITLQRIEYNNGDESYPLLYQGSHKRWEKGGYV